MSADRFRCEPRSSPRRNSPADVMGRLLSACARAADRRLDSLGLAPPPLDLPPEIHDDLRDVFGPTIDPATVMIRRGHIPGVPHRRAFALPGLIYLGADPGMVGGTTVSTGRPRATPTLVHELVHVWQGRYLGPRYVVTALVEQARYGRRAYDWRDSLTRAPRDGVRRDFPVEAHAQLVSEAYARRYGLGPAAGLTVPSRDLQIMQEALTGLRAGRAPTWRGRTV